MKNITCNEIALNDRRATGPCKWASPLRLGSLQAAVLLAALALLPVEAQEPGGSPRRGPGPRGSRSESFSSSFLPKSEREKAVFAVLEDMDRTQRRGSLSVPMEDGRILRVLTESTGAKHVAEIGTSIGYSGLWFCLALEQTGGKLTTFEIDPGRAAQARQNFKRAGMDKVVTVIEGDAHEKVKNLKEPIDILFLDADKEGYIDYLEKLLPAVRPGGLVVAHNITPGMADPRYLKAITSNPELESLFLNLDRSGISVTLKKR